MSPASAPKKGVQGARSTLDDLTLHDGKKLSVRLGQAIQPTPKLTRTMDGASNVTIPVLDPNRELLRDSLLAEKFDAEIDGLWFRYLGAGKAGQQLTVRLIDRVIARLQEFEGPKRWFREETTRAEVIKALFEEAVPGFPFYCPQLHVVQPIETKAQGKKAKGEADANRGKGIGDTKGLTVKGNKADPEQVNLADRVLRVCESHKATAKVMVAAMATIIVENELSNSGGDGLFQVTPETAASHHLSSHDVEACTAEWLTKGFWNFGGAISLDRENPTMSPGAIAQKAQGSAFPERYDEYASEAREWVSAFTGGELSGGSAEIIEPFELKVEAKEDYWEAAKRLAKDVNWRLFVLPDKAVYMPEPELFSGKVRLAIDADTKGVEDIDFDFSVNKPVNEATITAVADEWEVPPAAVVTVADYGPLSIGTGEAPVKADSKGRRAGISRALPAKTLEGKGRFLVSSIEADLDDDPEARKLSIKIKRPTPPLPEPAPTKSSVTLTGKGAGTAVGNATVERMLQAAEREAAKGLKYAWGGGHDAAFTGPYDCSGGVSFVLHVGGFLDSPLATTGLAGWGEAGPGEFITVYVKTSGGAEEEHTAIEIAGNVFESGGGGENTNSNGGWGKVDSGSVKSFLTQFDTKRHPKGY